jgi:hypothetical protein
VLPALVPAWLVAPPPLEPLTPTAFGLLVEPPSEQPVTTTVAMTDRRNIATKTTMDWFLSY